MHPPSRPTDAPAVHPPDAQHLPSWMDRLRRCALLAALASLTLTSRTRAEEPAPAPPQSPLSGLEALLRAEGCQPTEVLALEERWYAACGTQGVLVVQQRASATFELLERRRVAGEARAVFVRNGLVWVETQHIEATPLRALPISASTTAPASTSAQAPVTTKVVDDDATDRTIAPSRIGGIVALEAALRPFLPIDELAFAILSDFTLTYYGGRPWYAQVRVFPLGGMIGRGTDAGVFGVFATAGYDHPLFSVGLGAGTLRKNITREEYTPDLGARDIRDHEFAPTIIQAARLGATDGLSLKLTNGFTLSDDRWQFGFLDLSLLIPVGRRTWLTLGGGGGEQASFFYAELGLRRLLHGSRGHGSLFLRPTIGVGAIAPFEEGWAPGPMIGVHLEYRP